MNKRQFVIVGVALAVLVGSVLLSGFFSSLKEEPEFRKPPVPKKYVKTDPVMYSDIKTSVIAYGRVQAAQNVDLLSEVSGRMYAGSVSLKQGQSFKKGALLFYIDDQEASLNLKAQKSNFLRDIAAILPDLKVDFNDNFDAWNNYFNAIDIDKNLPGLPESRSEKEKTFLATRGVYSTFYSIKSAEVRLQKHRYYAPFDGSITEVNMESGSFINPGTKIGKIMRSDALELKVSVETKDIAWIHEGAPANVSSDETQVSFEGEVVRISDYVNPNTQSVDVYVKLFPGQNKIYDGQFMQASIPARTIKNGMIIPRNVIYNGNEVFVWQDTVLKVKEVDVYRLMEEEAIVGGISEGIDLVIEPLINAHNNMPAYKLDRTEIEYSKSMDASVSAESSSN
ncbi:MAG: HlyD family efflux transporter periplasmic adaptor subunit [Cyclobacteriaceae bacterium]